jgi:iron complex transport system ATP-binding protein
VGVIEARQVAVQSGGRALLEDVSIRVEPREVHAVLGANGAGKSTLVRVLSGGLAPAAGEVRLAGTPLAHWRPRERARLRALLPQESQLCFAFTAIEVVLLGRYPHHDGRPGARDERIAAEALARVDALHLAARVFPSLSGGERARVQLARALAQVWEPWKAHPRCLLLDEPIASLDIVHQHLTLDLVRTLAACEGFAVLVVLHDLNLALQYADRVTLLRAGRVHSQGRPAEAVTRESLRECFGLDALLVQPAPGRQVLVLARGGTTDAAA